jgi:hypothetical protein
VFSRIRDHEEIAERGQDPVAVGKARQLGSYEAEDGTTAPVEGTREHSASSSSSNNNKKKAQSGKPSFQQGLAGKQRQEDRENRHDAVFGGSGEAMEEDEDEAMLGTSRDCCCMYTCSTKLPL